MGMDAKAYLWYGSGYLSLPEEWRNDDDEYVCPDKTLVIVSIGYDDARFAIALPGQIYYHDWDSDLKEIAWLEMPKVEKTRYIRDRLKEWGLLTSVGWRLGADFS